MKRLYTKKFFTIALAVILLVQFTPYAKASYIDGHGYAVQRTSVSNYGGSFFTSTGETSLLSNYSPTYPDSFITNEMWLLFGSDSSQWVEIGVMKGALNGYYYAGRFAAVNSSDGYSEYSLQSSGGGVLLKLQHEGSKVWGAYVGTAKKLSLSSNYGISSNVDVGIETSYTENTFTSGVTNTNIQYKSTSNTWTNFSAFSNGDSNNLGWTSSYNSSTNTITYYR